jgi:hypothetical protein
MLTKVTNRAARLLLTVAMGLFGMVVAFAVATPAAHSAHSDLSPFDLQAPPATLEELVSNSRLIAVGTVGPLVHEDSFLGYDDQGNLVKAADRGLSEQAELPFYDYELHVDRVLKAAGPTQTGDTITLRVYVKATPAAVNAHLEYPPSVPGQQYLFFLNQNPDHQTYGLDHGLASRLIIDDAIVRMSDGARTPVTYYGKMTPQTFIKKVQEIIRAQ